MRARLTGIAALALLVASLVSTALAIRQLFGFFNPLAPFFVQFAAWLAVIVLGIALLPRIRPASGANLRDTRMRLHPSSFRAALTGPLAELSRPHSGWIKSWRRFPRPVLFCYAALTLLMFATYTFLPVGFLLAGMIFARHAAFEGDAVGIAIDRWLGTEPKLKRNRRKS